MFGSFTFQRILGLLKAYKLRATGKNYSISYSQESEDLIAAKYLSLNDTGFYVDVGAHHPMRFSNTYLFYQAGYQGINIEADIDLFSNFKQFRKKDINLNYAVAGEDKVKALEFYIFEEKALNTFDHELAKERELQGYKVKLVKQVETILLNDLLKQYLPKNQNIDLLNIDIEGLDYNVLKSFDFKSYSPKVIICENYSSTLEDLLKSKLNQLLISKSYSAVSKLKNSCIYLRNE
jgi:FkbM family methyltransferase